MAITKSQDKQNIVVISGHKSDADNEIVDIYKAQSAGRVIAATFDSASALGATEGIDILDGGTDGTGTTVIQASSNNLNGSEEQVGIGTDFDDGTVLRIRVDNLTAGIDIGWAVTVRLAHF